VAGRNRCARIELRVLVKHFLVETALLLLLVAGCGDDEFLRGGAPVKVTDTSSAIEANGRFRCSYGQTASSQSAARDEFDHVVQVEGRLTNATGGRATFTASLTILSADKKVRVEREWVMPQGTSVFLQFQSNDQALLGRESLSKVDPNIDRCDLSIR
jgi:hypothetical protein